MVDPFDSPEELINWRNDETSTSEAGKFTVVDGVIMFETPAPKGVPFPEELTRGELDLSDPSPSWGYASDSRNP